MAVVKRGKKVGDENWKGIKINDWFEIEGLALLCQGWARANCLLGARFLNAQEEPRAWSWRNICCSSLYFYGYQGGVH